MARVTVFFYGLFMDPALLRRQGVAPENPRAVLVAGYRLAIGTRAAMLPDPRGSVWGMAYDLTHAEIDSLYGDPSLADYREQAVITTPAAGPPFAALIYTLTPDQVGTEPNAGYAGELAAAMRRLGAPDEAIAQAERFA